MADKETTKVVNVCVLDSVEFTVLRRYALKGGQLSRQQLTLAEFVMDCFRIGLQWEQVTAHLQLTVNESAWKRTVFPFQHQLGSLSLCTVLFTLILSQSHTL